MIKIKQFPVKNEASLKQLFNTFLTSKKALGVKDKTLQTYMAHLNSMAYHLNVDAELDKIGPKEIDDMIVSMRESGLSPNSIRSYTITLRAFFNWCNEQDLSSLKVKAYKGEEKLKDTYTDDELIKLLRKPNLRTCQFAEYRSWVIINLILNCGCRAGTIREMRIKDLDLDQGYIYYRHTKSSKVQVAPLCSTMIDILYEYLSYREGDEDDYLFCNSNGGQLKETSLQSAIWSYNMSRGVQKTSIHLFRHTFAKKYLLDCDGNALVLQKILGHSTMTMTTRYCNIYNADLACNYDEKSPLSQIQKKAKTIKMQK